MTIVFAWGTTIILMPGRNTIVILVPIHTPAHLLVRAYNQICWYDTFESFTAICADLQPIFEHHVESMIFTQKLYGSAAV